MFMIKNCYLLIKRLYKKHLRPKILRKLYWMIKYLLILKNIKEMIFLIPWPNTKNLSIEIKHNKEIKDNISQIEDIEVAVVVLEAITPNIEIKNIQKEDPRRVMRQKSKEDNNRTMKDPTDEKKQLLLITK